jgi:prolipoprotein diacylglyceryltransferase
MSYGTLGRAGREAYPNRKGLRITKGVKRNFNHTEFQFLFFMILLCVIRLHVSLVRDTKVQLIKLIKNRCTVLLIIHIF